MNNFLSEFLYSAVLWGSLLTALLWWLRSKAKSRVSRGLLFLPFWWLVLHTAIAWYGVLIPPSGRLVDADSGEPIKNARVIATWISYPMAIWTSHCSGRQAHLTDGDGGFAFRFAPYPTLAFGTLFRGLNPKVPGRISNQKFTMLLKPLWGDVPIQKYAPGRWTSEIGPNTGCRVAIAPQFDYADGLLPGEELPFDVMYREACIERQPGTFTNEYLYFMMQSSSDSAGQRHVVSGLDDPKWIAVQELRPQIVPAGCPPIGNLCAVEVSAKVHDAHCEYFSWLRELNGSSQ
ncbi:MAG: hypothetical protein SGI99_10730 [Pseudomonadota bacterium]|nr:hypothetical protein [Pseudomonadota bacterium]